ncbi:alanine/glycine:cation symporter family protein [Neolewinella antarctica]|uniref:AGCS family alanine or glycine:cation symporter n=1 Tax=Neolewinella antarctica TaxID=442734 RepID=A0ABX0X648_9BACT|nr:alanine/glycine:cation symporter family protein [Neolewinella antarctica]NJC24607.1 AGCS family alanine or glycine:cation symporter [Neolewinella antarctica]
MLKKYVLAILGLFSPIFLLAQEEAGPVDAFLQSIFEPVTAFVEAIVFFPFPFLIGGQEVPFVLPWLIIGATVFTVYMGFINITAFRHAIDVVRGIYDDPNEPGEVSHFQALTAALSGTVGVGNIAGVAYAVALGGPGATFWMIVAGFLGMSSKFVECSLGVMYRDVHADGSVSGGPMYYLDRGLAEKGKNWGILGKVLAVFFAIFCIGGSLGGGNMVQINQATVQLTDITGGVDSIFYGRGWIFGTAMALVVGLIILGGIKSIAKVTDKVVPFMVGVYILGALIVLGYHFTDIPAAFGQIIGGAFNSDALYGGAVGVLIQGFRRAAFSNEAGVGSASIAHSAAKTDEPISEGIVALLEPFIDTVVVCTMTALVIVITNYGGYGAVDAFANKTNETVGDIALTSAAFESVISWFPIVLGIAVILFALSTMISWSYYGLKCWTYLFGQTKTQEAIYKIIFCLFVIIGSGISAKAVFDFGDAMIFAMCFPNVLGLYFLMPNVRRALKDYMSRIKDGSIKQFDKEGNVIN